MVAEVDLRHVRAEVLPHTYTYTHSPTGVYCREIFALMISGKVDDFLTA